MKCVFVTAPAAAAGCFPLFLLVALHSPPRGATSSLMFEASASKVSDVRAAFNSHPPLHVSGNI